MHRIDGAAAAPGGFFTDGDPTVGTPATVVTDDWLNSVQEEIVAVILSAGIALSKPSNEQLLAAIGVLIARAVPPGALQDFARPTAPTGWLVCDGSAVSRTAYPALFGALGTQWGIGDGSTTFNLPDFRGEFRRGWDSGRGVDPGRAFGTSQAGAVELHSHAIATVNAVENTDLGYIGESGQTIGLSLTRATTQPAGGAETRPRNVAVLACIKY